MGYIGKKDIAENDRYLLLNRRVKQMLIFNRSPKAAREESQSLQRSLLMSVLRSHRRLMAWSRLVTLSWLSQSMNLHRKMI